MFRFTNKCIFWIVFATAIPIAYYIYNPGIIGYPTLIMGLIIFYQVYRLSNANELIKVSSYKLINYWIVISLFGIIHSIFSIPMDSKSISMLAQSFLGLSALLVIFTIRDLCDVKLYIRYFYILYIPVAIFSFFNWSGFSRFDVSHIFIPFTLFLVLVPYESKKNVLFNILLLLIAIIADTSVRSTVVSYLFILFFYLICLFFKETRIQKICSFIRILLLCLPLVLAILGITGKFNVFQDMEQLEILSEVGSAKNRDNVFLDTRTGIYIDALNALDTPEHLFFGRGSVTTIECTTFGSHTDQYDSGRHSVEAGILNILIFYGVLGLLFFIIMMWYITYVGMTKTSNILTMLASVYLAYKFMYMFVEDAVINISTYIAMGICLNKNIRQMTNEEIEYQIRNII